jgi:hypothetical protein
MAQSHGQVSTFAGLRANGMGMKTFAGLLAVLASGWVLGVAGAQDLKPPPPTAAQPVENVIVTEPRFRTEEALDAFIIGHAAPTPLLGKIGRWKTGICPVTIGLPEKFSLYVTERIIKLAMAAGAPLAKGGLCRPDVAVLATPEPQKLLDFVRAKRPALLGFHYHSQAERIATMRLPIQAWYSTATEDFWGLISADLPSGDLGYGVMSSFGYLPRYHVSGFRTGDGLKSEFTTAIIIMDTTKIVGQEIGPLADYIAMLALSQGQYYDTCQEVPTITNLMAGACAPEMKPAAITDVDLDYLRGLYSMNAGGSYIGERSAIAYEMKKDLGGY